MKTLVTINQLEQYFPQAQFVLSYAETFNTKEVRWVFDRLRPDTECESMYHATFGAEDRSHQWIPECVLEFTFTIIDAKKHDYEYKLIKKVDSPPHDNG